MKTKIIGISIVVFIAIVVGIFIFRTREYDSKLVAKVNTPTKQPSQTVVSQDLQEYTDPAGFKFSHPRSILISPKKIVDDSIYTSIEATSSSKPGAITIQAISSNLLTLESLIPSQTKIVDLKLADLVAKQYTEKNKTVTLALDKGVLFTITVSSAGETNFWNEVNNKILSSFTFSPPEIMQDASGSVPSESDVTFEGEETIE